MYTFLYTYFCCLSFYYTLYLGRNQNLLFMRKTIFFLFAVLIGQFAMADNNIDLVRNYPGPDPEDDPRSVAQVTEMTSSMMLYLESDQKTA